MSSLSHAAYATLLGSTFELLSLDASMRARLLRVSPRVCADGWESFSLLFEGKGPSPFGQGMVDVQHPELPDHPLFLVPIGPAQGGQGGICYEAVFYRRI
jgi:hypothetical protein